MSHTTAIGNVAITDIDALRSTVAKLKAQGINCDLVERQKPRMYYGNQHGVCDYVLRLHDCPYDVGFDKNKDGAYVPVFDEWGNHIAKQIGVTGNFTGDNKSKAHIGKLMQGYATEAAINAAVAQGYYVEGTEVDAQGNVQLLIGGMA